MSINYKGLHLYSRRIPPGGVLPQFVVARFFVEDNPMSSSVKHFHHHSTPKWPVNEDLQEVLGMTSASIDDIKTHPLGFSQAKTNGTLYASSDGNLLVFFYKGQWRSLSTHGF